MVRQGDPLPLAHITPPLAPRLARYNPPSSHQRSPRPLRAGGTPRGRPQAAAW